ncbi:uncharacterized protein METZ01_LOCUS398113, partial [marine metagenome]
VANEELILGRIKKLGAREIFKHEAHTFTPWLADNLNLLADAIGIPLEAVATEVPVGDFSLAIHAEDPDGKTVIIENQFGRTDHDHLGKVLVYGAGQDASIVVWVAEDFRDEHRAAIDWLNENSATGGPAFFAVALGAIAIDNSAPAPTFEVVCQPNDFKPPPTPHHRWTVDSFKKALAESNLEWLAVAEKIFQHSDERGWALWHGSGQKFGSTYFYCRENQRPMLFAIWTNGDFFGGWANHDSHSSDSRWDSLIEFFLK